jgi:hypothetical protein
VTGSGGRLAALAVLALAALPATAAARPEFGTVPRADGPLKIDGLLDEPAWQKALAIPLPYEVYPGDNAPAEAPTTALLLFDDRNLYVGFRAEDPAPDRIRAHYTDRDTAFRNDLVGVLLDPFDDQRHGYVFAANPYGVQMDSRAQQNGEGEGFNIAGAPSEESSWDELWDAAGRIGPGGFAVEIAIPFKSLRYPRGEGAQAWGFVAFRQRPRTERVRTQSSPIDRDDNCWFCQLGRIVLPEAPRPGLAIELLPTLTWLRSEARADPASDLEVRQNEVDAGLSARWGFTPNSSLNLALNPDFSQIEADAIQLDVNNRFALYYPEKRPLFLEGADLFATPIGVVYTRTIVDPSAVAKVTMREGRNSLGAFVARDEPTAFVLPYPDGSTSTGFPGANTTGVLRYRRDIGSGSSIGAIATLRDGEQDAALDPDADPGYRNFVGGLDGVFRLSPTDVVTAQWLTTSTDYPDDFAAWLEQPDGEFSGKGWTADYAHEARFWSWYAGAGARSPGFRADAGFIPRIDIRSAYAAAGRSFYAPAGSWWTRLRLFAEWERAENTLGELLEDEWAVELNYSGPWQSSVELRPMWVRESFQGTVYDQVGVQFFGNVRPTGSFTTSLGAFYGDGIDYANNRPGRQLMLEPGLTWNIGRHLYLQLDDEWERFEEAGGRLYWANQANARFIYQIDVRTFVRLVVQWTAIDRNTALYDERELPPARERRLLGQFLFAYKLNPQTVLFAGFDGRSFDTEEAPRYLEGRSVFVKIGYDWRP